MFKLRYSQYFIPKSPTNDTITIASDENPVITDNGDIEADTIIPETESSTSNQQSCEARDLVFKEREGGHHISLLPGKNRVLTYIFEIESLLRQDVLTSFWNKVHNNTDKIEITAFVKTKERFSLFLGRRSFFCSDTLKDKLVCSESNDLSYLNLPKYILYLTECSGLGNILGINVNIDDHQFFDSIRNNIRDFNYLYISDLPRTDVEHEALRTYGCNGIFIRISLICKSVSDSTQAKIEKSRLKLQEQKLKEDHQKRQELAMKKKDEKIRALKERIMSEADVDKQIKMKEKFDRMEAKNKMKKCNKGKSVMVIS
ncbi:hypothetical protein RF11_14582 [Thelohanellus kitauei]|uniref:Coiled-coil domain-containing protein 47 n=1 Tax=Thelohanellus kitauei TaxID=669202 RepID=A0A0C2MN69_THEKT|nr:hypothetical protein RF11_14582 [Thelohanellus kitauei]